MKPEAELRALDALLQQQEPERWDRFFADRARPCPFFVDSPDESLVQWLAQERPAGGRALDIGCGHGRNAIALARHGFRVDALDFSKTALDWTAERARDAGVPLNLIHDSVFDAELEEGTYQLVYDSGCFHHIAPHRRAGYVDLVARSLAPGGWFGMTAFRPEGGSGFSDEEVYERRTLGGGLGYTEAQLRTIWTTAFEVREVRQMRKPPAGSGLFGEPFLWVMWATRR